MEAKGAVAEQAGKITIMPSDVKERINQLLWYALPDTVTIGQAEHLSIQIFLKITSCWERRYTDIKDRELASKAHSEPE